MNALYFLIPLALILAGVLLLAFWWAVRSGQFDDLEGPAWSILMDDDEIGPPAEPGVQAETQTESGESIEPGADPAPPEPKGNSRG